MSTAKIKRDCLKELEDKFGRVTAQALVDAARSSRHPLHNDFEWDERKGAAKYRLLQARAIIRSVRIVVTVDHRKISSVSYVRDPSANGPGYRSIVQIRSETDVATEALLNEMDRVSSILQRAREIAAVLGLADEFQASLDSIAVLQSTVRSRTGQANEASAGVQ